MTQNVFNSAQIKSKSEQFQLQLVHTFAPQEEEVEEVVEEPVYTGPTIEELEAQANEFRAKFEEEKAEMLSKAQESADEIVKRAETAAFAEVKRQTDQAQVIKTEAEAEAQRIVSEAEAKAQEILDRARQDANDIMDNTSREGFETGRQEGYQSGEEEVKRLVERTHKIYESVMASREDILSSTEQQIVELVILMARKVVKVISENQKSVVIANILQALKKVKGRGNVNIHVNLEDVKLTTQHTQDFINQIENVQGVTVLEDSSVEKGGCVIETDFGSIDARISSQLTELEQKILEIAPVKTLAKSQE